jgi:hypothetical protein
MTVQQTDHRPDGAVECIWITADGAFSRVTLPAACLELVSSIRTYETNLA